MNQAASWALQNWFRLAITVVAVGSLAVVTHHLIFLEERANRREIEAQQRAAADREHEMRAYAAKRRNDCYDIYSRERVRSSNTDSEDYDQDSDVCTVFYRSDEPRAANLSCKRLRQDSTLVHSSTPYATRILVECAGNLFHVDF